MASYSSSITSLHFLLLLVFFSAATAAQAASESSKCDASFRGECHNKAEAMRLKIIAIAAILSSSFIGVCLPLVSRFVPALHPDRDLFVVLKALASGVILATGQMHVLPDAFNDLSSPCLPETPWRKFPFATFVAMLSAVCTLMLDSVILTCYTRRKMAANEATVPGCDNEMVPAGNDGGHSLVHQLDPESKPDPESNDEQERESTLLRNRVIAQLLELGIIVHSVAIGLSMGASQNTCTIRSLVAALCFHQLFEGMGLGGCILQAEYGMRTKAILSFFFATTTPLGVVLGIGLSNVYRENSPTALAVVGVLNAASAGLLNYMALVNLLAATFLGPRLQGSLKLQGWGYAGVLLGAGGMAVMAKWA